MCTWLKYLFHAYIGGIKLGDLIILTSSIEKKWFKLGIALGIRISKMLKFQDKYKANPMRALLKVYHHWLSDDENRFSPTWEKLGLALRIINELTLAANVEAFPKVSLIVKMLYVYNQIVRYIELK